MDDSLGEVDSIWFRVVHVPKKRYISFLTVIDCFQADLVTRFLKNIIIGLCISP